MALPLLQQIGQNIVTQNEHISQFPVFLQFYILALVYITKKCNEILRNSIKLVQYLLFTNFLYRQSGWCLRTVSSFLMYATFIEPHWPGFAFFEPGEA